MEDIIRQLHVIESMPLSAEQRKRAVSALQLLVDGIGHDFVENERRSKMAGRSIG